MLEVKSSAYEVSLVVDHQVVESHVESLFPTLGSEHDGDSRVDTGTSPHHEFNPRKQRQPDLWMTCTGPLHISEQCGASLAICDFPE
jgi:hypothetical protein